MSTKRTDRTGIDRNELRQDELVSHEVEINAQATINISRKRLCYQASKETREAWIEYLNGLKLHEPELYKVSVPDCVYRCGCPEFKSCNLFEEIFKDLNKEELLDINKRYEEYLKFRDKEQNNDIPRI